MFGNESKIAEYIQRLNLAQMSAAGILKHLYAFRYAIDYSLTVKKAITSDQAQLADRRTSALRRHYGLLKRQRRIDLVEALEDAAEVTKCTDFGRFLQDKKILKRFRKLCTYGSYPTRKQFAFLLGVVGAQFCLSNGSRAGPMRSITVKEWDKRKTIRESE